MPTQKAHPLQEGSCAVVHVPGLSTGIRYHVAGYLSEGLCRAGSLAGSGWSWTAGLLLLETTEDVSV